MKRILGIVALLVALSAPAFALEGANFSASSEKPMSIIEFAQLEGNHGATRRVLQRRYEEYRNFRLAASTLDVSRAR